MDSNHHKKFNFRTLLSGSTLQLLAVIILPLALLILLIVFSSVGLHQSAMRDMVIERDEIAISVVAGAIESEINHRLMSITNWVSLIHSSAFEQAEVTESTLFNTSFFNLGTAIISSEEELVTTNAQEIFRSLIENQELSIQDISAEGTVRDVTINGQPALLFGAASHDNQFYIAGIITVEELSQDIIQKARPPESETHIYIINQNNEILFSLNAISQNNQSNVNLDASSVFEQNRMNVIDRLRLDMIVTQSQVPSTSWTVVMEEPWEALASPLLETTRIAPLALVPLLLIALAGVWFASRQIVQPLQTLEKKSALLASGDFSEIEEPVGGIAEIRNLQSQLSSMAHKVQTAQRSLHDYIGAITDAQEEERRRLSRDLHDDTLQSMIALKQRMMFIKQSVDDEETQSALSELLSITEQTYENLRRVTRDLRPIYLEDLGLATALEMLVRKTGTLSDVIFNFIQRGQEIRLSPDIELSLYRMTQEALSNIIRHARASKAHVVIRYLEQQVELIISDNGIGFDPPGTPTDYAAKGHFGLLGLYERADLIGASLEIKSGPECGTRIKITVDSLVKESGKTP